MLLWNKAYEAQIRVLRNRKERERDRERSELLKTFFVAGSCSVVK